MFNLAAPWFLLLLPLPLLVLWFTKPYQPPRSNLQVPFLGRLAELGGGVLGDKKSLPTKSVRCFPLLTQLLLNK